MEVVECPYCEKDQEICHDDGFGYEEETPHEQECGDCEKTFIFYTSISFSYEGYKADCLNDEPHQWNESRMYWFDEQKKQELWGRRCKDCDLQEQGFDPEWARNK